jgi:hypothetical protein
MYPEGRNSGRLQLLQSTALFKSHLFFTRKQSIVPEEFISVFLCWEWRFGGIKNKDETGLHLQDLPRDNEWKISIYVIANATGSQKLQLDYYRFSAGQFASFPNENESQ